MIWIAHRVCSNQWKRAVRIWWKSRESAINPSDLMVDVWSLLITSRMASPEQFTCHCSLPGWIFRRWMLKFSSSLMKISASVRWKKDEPAPLTSPAPSCTGNRNPVATWSSSARVASQPRDQLSPHNPSRVKEVSCGICKRLASGKCNIELYLHN